MVENASLALPARRSVKEGTVPVDDTTIGQYRMLIESVG
jgi:hypothetical protein